MKLRSLGLKWNKYQLIKHKKKEKVIRTPEDFMKYLNSLYEEEPDRKKSRNYSTIEQAHTEVAPKKLNKKHSLVSIEEGLSKSNKMFKRLFEDRELRRLLYRNRYGVKKTNIKDLNVNTKYARKLFYRLKDAKKFRWESSRSKRSDKTSLFGFRKEAWFRPMSMYRRRDLSNSSVVSESYRTVYTKGSDLFNLPKPNKKKQSPEKNLYRKASVRYLPGTSFDIFKSQKWRISSQISSEKALVKEINIQKNFVNAIIHKISIMKPEWSKDDKKTARPSNPKKLIIKV